MNSDAAFDQALELFVGRSSAAQAHVYARLPESQAPRGAQLVGRLVGPECRYAQTLPATFRLADCGPGDSLLARSVVPEPCFWTAAMPHLYRAEVRLVQGDTTLAAASRTLGLCAFGAADRHLICNSKRWVMRGVHREATQAADLESWHAAETAMVVSHPDEQLCVEASRIGVLLVAELESATLSELRRLSRWPAVGLVTLPGNVEVDPAAFAHTWILAQRISSDTTAALQPWAQAIVCDIRAVQSLLEDPAAARLPILVSRPLDSSENLVAARAGCDHLQRDLAAIGQFAGYLV